MAARLDLYLAPDAVSLAGSADSDFASDAFTHLGFISASDADEALLFALLSDVDANSYLDATVEGAGVVRAADVASVASVLAAATPAAARVEPGTAEHDTVVAWITTATRCALGALAAGTAMAWRMRFDLAGSVDSGDDEFPTAWAVSHN